MRIGAVLAVCLVITCDPWDLPSIFGVPGVPVMESHGPMSPIGGSSEEQTAAAAVATATLSAPTGAFPPATSHNVSHGSSRMNGV